MSHDSYEASGQGILILVTYFGVVGGLALAGWVQQLLGARVMFRVMAAIVSIGMAVLLLAECVHDEESEDGGREKTAATDEARPLVPSESCASSSSAFADQSTER